jgi:TRAP-type C4-dicarboxylate transport system permease small subunit
MENEYLQVPEAKLDSRTNISKAEKVLDHIFTVLFSVVFFLMLLAVAYQIIARTLGISNTWTEELSRWLFVWICFLGAAYFVKKKQHIIVDLILEVRILKKISKYSEIFFRVLMLSFFLVLAIGGIQYIMQFGGKLSAGLRIPERVLLLSAPVSFILMCAFELWNIFDVICAWRRKGGEK